MKLTATLVAALMASSTNAILGAKPPKPVKPHIVDGFAWKDPFALQAMSAFEPACEATSKFNHLEYTLHDLMGDPPLGLKPWSDGLKKLFSEREYPGGWSGWDKHGYDRTILRMDYVDIPLELRKWIEEQERTGGSGKGLFGVFVKPASVNDTITEVAPVPAEGSTDRSADGDKVAIFAPGAIYHVLPLWAAEDSKCKDDLLDLTKYKPQPKSGNVVGWATHTEPKKDKSAEFTIKVQSLREKNAKDEL